MSTRLTELGVRRKPMCEFTPNDTIFEYMQTVSSRLSSALSRNIEI